MSLFRALPYSHPIPRRHSWHIGLFFVALTIGIAAILSADLFQRGRFAVVAGDITPTDITAPRSIFYVSEVATEAQRQRVAREVPIIYTPPNRDIGRVQRDQTVALFRFLNVVRSDKTAKVEWKIAALQQLDLLALDGNIAEKIVRASDSSLAKIEQQAVGIVDALMRERVLESDLNQLEPRLRGQLSFSLTPAEEETLLAILPQLIRANSSADEEETEKARQAAIAHVQPVTSQIVANEIIARQGDTLSAETIETLAKLDLLYKTTDYKRIIQHFLVALATSMLILFYYRQYAKERYHRRRYWAFFTTLFLIFLGLGVAGIHLPQPWQYAYPAASFALLLAVIYDMRYALFISIILGALLGYSTANEFAFEYAGYTAAGGMLALLTLRDTQRINGLLWAGVVAGVGNVIAIFIFNFARLSPDALLLINASALGLLSGLLSGGIAVIGCFIVGSLFHIPTMIQLQEWARFDQPLLTEMIKRAPGTYHHSLTVAVLAEQAAQKIGANGLLVRVGALYHDIGKLDHPEFFTENQMGQNPHDQLLPQESARYILRHVSDGLAIGQKKGLPDVIQEFIQEHHGTQLLKYFYKKGVERNPSADPALYTYPGPKPHSREIGLVMIADAIEATSKAVQPNNPQAIEKLVRSIIDDLLTTGQLEASYLSLNDIQLARESFIETLQGRFHVRVKYAGNEQIEQLNTTVEELPILPPPSSLPSKTTS